MYYNQSKISLKKGIQRKMEYLKIHKTPYGT